MTQWEYKIVPVLGTLHEDPAVQEELIQDQIAIQRIRGWIFAGKVWSSTHGELMSFPRPSSEESSGSSK